MADDTITSGQRYTHLTLFRTSRGTRTGSTPNAFRISQSLDTRDSRGLRRQRDRKGDDNRPGQLVTPNTVHNPYRPVCASSAALQRQPGVVTPRQAFDKVFRVLLERRKRSFTHSTRVTAMIQRVETRPELFFQRHEFLCLVACAVDIQVERR
ncbi:hypothetical protein BD289DRAFT_137416 [Coniella lustricola]|uniref:Uncharacterized protein n=1 Tax=Coniella lustricola TaxID=2025994 RepID=A0A2T2ZVL1_9PEZI|nr:hypothetical protein BD289DRAFT_137416 [Coniella lustricola]